MNKELTPHGWMQRDLEKTNHDYIEPEDNGSITNIDDTGTLMRKNPLLRDERKEEEQHMIAHRKNIIEKTILKLAKPSLTSPDGKEALDLLQQALIAEFQQWDLYYAYKTRLKGLSRDPLAAHFEEHAGQEAGHIEVLQRYILAMGATPTTDRKKIPQLKGDNVQEIIELQLQFEAEAVELYKNILKKLKDESAPLRVEIENILAVEAEHMHDLQMLLRE